MKDRIISFILTTIIIGILVFISILGYSIYSEVTGDGRIEISFENETGFPTIEYIHSNNDAIIIDEEMFNGVDGTTSNTDNNTNTTKSRYLYNQLGETAKTLYRGLYQRKENLKTGTYKVDFGNVFQSLLSKENGDAELKEQYQAAIEALVYENPDIFYLDVTKMYINIERITKITGTKYNVYIDNGNEFTYLAEGFYCKEDVETYEAKIMQVKNQIISQIEGKTTYEKIKLIHNYLIDTVKYEGTLTQPHIYDIYGALINRNCVCEGYAKAFQYLMNEIGVENTIVIGTATNSKNETENHAWNYIKLEDGKWYAVDVTWDDPVIRGGGKLTNKARYEYFLRGSQTMNKNHVPSGRFTQQGRNFEYPELSIEDYK